VPKPNNLKVRANKAGFYKNDLRESVLTAESLIVMNHFNVIESESDEDVENALEDQPVIF